MSILAIVIPYYKPQFFREALLSIKEQTNKNFNLYIGDDCSPHNPESILTDVFGSAYHGNLNYYRFNENLGGTSLTLQWERCIDRSDEKYIWLFSDDDLMPPDAVERFYKFIEKDDSADIIGFDIKMIDQEGLIIHEGYPHPVYESAESFLHARLRGLRLSTACEYIFKRDVYIKKGKFVDFPLAWASDDATWLNFAEDKGFYTIAGDPVKWRFSGLNLSAANSNYKEKITAALLFIKFIRKKYRVERNLELNWLVFQLRLMRGSKETTRFFLRSLFRSNLFSVFTIVSFGWKKFIGRVAARKHY